MYEPAEGAAMVETHPWVDAADASALVANFARVHILVSIFDGDPEKWIRFIQRSGTAVEKAHDLPFAQSLQQRLTAQPSLLNDLRRIVREFSAIIGD